MSEIKCEHDWFDCSNERVLPPAKSCRKCGWTVGEDEERGMFVQWPWLPTLSSAAVAEREAEPFGYVCTKGGTFYEPHLSNTEGLVAVFEHPPTSELEAEIARFRAERDDFKDEWQAELEKRMEVQVRLRATEARLAEAKKALEQIAAIEPVSNCDAGSMARSRMRDIARYSIARRPK